MNRILAGKLLLSFVLLGGAAMSFLLDWSPNHLLNPLWHPHASYHAAILLFLFAGVAATATWLLWRPSREPATAFTSATLLSLSYWTPFFYVPQLPLSKPRRRDALRGALRSRLVARPERAEKSCQVPKNHNPLIPKQINLKKSAD